DQAGNVLNVPPVNIINSEYFSYVLNRGSGNAPTANFEVIESSLTNWEYYGKYPEWQGSESNKGITSIAWASSGENLVAGIGLSSARVSGEIELNLAYVPGRNWQSVLDMTTRKIKFTITPGAGLVFDPAAKVTASIFVKNSEGSWPGEYSVPVEIDLTGEGTELYLVPTVEMFHEGFFQAGFDPTAVGLIGLKVQCDNGKTVTGTFDISYTLESITEAGSELLDTGGLPSMPVWVDQRAFSDYIRAEGIELFCSSGIFDMADTLSRLVPSYNLPSDFAAYTVFDGDDNVVSITRANGSTAFIDGDGRIDLITHRDGSVFVDYEYDEEGDLVSATLVSSRKRIEDAIEDAAFRMEKEKVDRMLYLDTVDEVVREEFEEDVARARAEFAGVRRQLESQLYVEVKRGFWFWTWTERVEVPGVRAEIEKLNQREREFNRDISEKMAERDGAFREVRDTAEAEFARVTEEYAWQRRKLLLATARQEAVPVIHYYYWEVLGREPGEEELENLFRRVDETNLFAGIFEEDITDKESFILRIGALSDTPFYGLLPEDLKSFVSGFTAGSVIPDETVNALITALDKMISGEELYAAMIGRYGSEQALREELSEATLGYISELAVVSAENVLVGEEYALKTAELSLIKANIESFRALKIELLRLLENPETISSYTGYWRDNLFNIYDASSLILKKDRLYLRSFDELAGVYTETELTGFLESYTAEFSVLGEIRSIVMPGDLLSMEMAYAEFIDVVARYSSHMEELLARGDIAREWMNRGIIQDHFAGCIVSKDKNTIEFSAENLKNELIASEEHSALLAFKESVILAVSEFLDAYLSDGAAREGLLAGIGLAPEDVIDLTSL
ncbi:MAG TPA: hypothetical protein PKZ41_03255, partial [Candidatus Omnitrophota bacterium]|nr:hypothetical protein [Candidatus Omnitrophota bacterium]